MSEIRTENCLGFCCPHENCRYKSKKFGSLRAVNNHLNKSHNFEFKMDIDRQSRTYLRRTS